LRRPLLQRPCPLPDGQPDLRPVLDDRDKDFSRFVEAVASVQQAETMRGPFAAELLDVEGLRIVKYLPGNGGASPQAAE